MATEMAETICNELGMEIENVNFYTDSKVVLGYIHNSTRRFYVYVTNRVQKIRRSTRPTQWSYVPTDKNPADLATRGVSAATIMHSSWIKGPSQLHTSNESNAFPLVDIANDKELRPEVTVHKTDINDTSLDRRFEKFSQWRSLVRAICTIRHFIKSWLAKHDSSHDKDGAESALLKEYQDSERFIIHNAQKELFSAEIESLRNQKPIPKASGISSLSLFIDNQGLLRVGGRLSRADLTSNEKHPIIIPGNHHIAKLLIRHVHENVQHQGRHFTEGGIRSAGYWVTGGKRLISSVLHHCVTCKKLRGKTEFQKMSDLPIDRVTPAPPFSYVGVDTFGPWTISTRRTRGGAANSKRWAIMFSCLTSRGVHIELVEEMSASSFINALRRFVAIRGPVTEFRSDRGTNFVGAIDDMKINVVNVEDKSINQFLLNNDTTWKFNVPHSSHMAGSWEWMIGVARRILDAMLLKENRLTHEILSTLMAEVCAIINGRPIVAVSSDPEAPNILSPSTLLTQKTNRNNSEYLENIDIRDIYKSQWKYVQMLSDVFWNQWKKQYLQTLQTRSKWSDERDNLKVGDIVLMKDKDLPRNQWTIAKIEEVFPSEDNRVRKVSVRVQSRTYTRPITELVYLLSSQTILKMD